MTLPEAFTELMYDDHIHYKINITMERLMHYRGCLNHDKPIPIDVMEEFLLRAKYVKLKDGNWFLPPQSPIMEIEI